MDVAISRLAMRNRMRKRGKRKLKHLSVAVAVVALLTSQFGKSAIGADAPQCKGSPLVVGACFNVHGRLSIYNGSIVVRIWPVRTNRLLGVLNLTDQAADPVLPESINRLLVLGPGSTVAVFGDYEICPVTRQETDHMQLVCLESASHLVARSLWVGHALPSHY